MSGSAVPMPAASTAPGIRPPATASSISPAAVGRPVIGPPFGAAPRLVLDRARDRGPDQLTLGGGEQDHQRQAGDHDRGGEDGVGALVLPVEVEDAAGDREQV